ncbi:hypothetical protein Y032_0005g2536 [Ancylostoma ceylanicum]|uniref:Reverse transcriptase domain-containing protein n=1 Tax=Ancylostoma ceylanicum TaxID=53326 RepID=A0A016VRN6_9BILA|nr:hypothetical protein Y032_0005g2536 [Ancylostoma ceylanicum]
MRRLEWDNMGVRVHGRLLHHLRFADDIVLITPNTSQAERMLADFDDACGKIGLQLDITNTMFMRNGWVPDDERPQHDERPRSRAGQEEASGLGILQDHRGRIEEDEEHQAPCPPLQHHGSPCFDLRFGNLGVT